MGNNWATLMVNNWATFVQLKNRQRGPVIAHSNFGVPLFFLKKISWNPHFYSVLWLTAFSEKNKRGPVINH